MKSSPHASAIRFIVMLLVSAGLLACGSRTPLETVPTSGGGSNDDPTNPDASRDPDASADASLDRSLDGRADNDVSRDADVRDALDGADIPDIPDVLPCFAESREGKGIPIDFYFVVDKSNSMSTDAGMQSRWSAMVNALNAFVRSPASAGLGAGVNFFPKSSNGTNTLCNVNDYGTPDVPIGLLPDVALQIATSLAAQRLGPGTPTTPALEASLAYAKAQKIARVTRDVAVVLVTDGVPTQCSSTIASTVAVARNYATGSPPVRTYVLGIGPSVDNLNALAQAGGTAPARLIESGGEAELLAAFSAIRDNSITCDYLIPMRPGEILDYALVNIQVRVGVSGALMPIAKVNDAAACSAQGGWFYDQPVPPGNPPPTRITLCPATCDPLVQTAGSHLDMLVGCKTSTSPSSVERAVDSIATLRAACDAAGLDIVHPFRLDWFNDAVAPALCLPDGGRPRALGVVVANTRRLWPVFTRALGDDVAWRGDEHPLDTYVERAVTRAAAQSFRDAHRIFFAHRMTPAPIAVQRIAHASGLAHLSPSRLSVHPRFGPWLALRAVIVVDVEGPSGPAPQAPESVHALRKTLHRSAEERAMASTDATRPGDVERQWKLWVNVRDVCPEGRAERYDDEQVRYHYAKDRAILLRLVHRG